MTFCDEKSQGSLDINQDVVLDATMPTHIGFDGLAQKESLPFGEERLHLWSL